MAPGYRNSLVQVLRLQELSFNTAELLAADVASVEDKVRRAKIAQSFSQVVKGWETLEDRKRIIRGQPLPGSKRPAVDQPKKKQSNFAPPTE